MAPNIILKIDEEVEERLNQCVDMDKEPLKILADAFNISVKDMQDVCNASKINIESILEAVDEEVPEHEKMHISFVRGFALGKFFGEYLKGSRYGF